jgi:hypothetical protein
MMGRELGKQMLQAVKEYVARALAPIAAGMEELRKQLEAMPTPKDGVEGKDGKDIDPLLVRQMIEAEAAKAVLAMPAPLPGEKGEPGTAGIDGIDGRDALDINVLPEIDEAKAYPRGTFALHRGGMIRAERKTEPILDSLEKAGWRVCLNGIVEETETVSEDGRTIARSTVYTNGLRLERTIKTAAIVYRGIWKEADYERGDIVTRGGSSYHCQLSGTKQVPGTLGADDWKMMVKSGRDGKDGAPGPEGKPGKGARN